MLTSVIRTGSGELKIAEVASRFTDVKDFVSLVKSIGFRLTSKVSDAPCTIGEPWALIRGTITSLVLLGRVQQSLHIIRVRKDGEYPKL